MAPKGMYFGTKEYMTWVPAPAIEPAIPSRGWSESGTFLNGGAYVVSSTNKHATYSFSWTLKPHEELSKIEDFYKGVYGDGPFYFLLPGTYANVLPPSWAVGRIQGKDGLPLVDGPRPRLIPQAAGINRYPTASAHYVLNDLEAARRYLDVPVPSGHYLHLGVHGSFSGDARMVYAVDGGVQTALVPLDSIAADQANTTVAGPAWVTLSLQGTGTATINSMVAEISEKATPRVGTFVAGRGHSGVAFNGDNGFQLSMYSAVKNLYGATAEFIEVGQWL